MYDDRFGERDGLTERLEEWARRLGQDKSLPWAGLGLIKDLNTAVSVLRGEEPPKPDPRQTALEFDL